MSRGSHSFRQSDLAKALKAAAQAGLSVARLEIGTDGKIIVIAGKPEQVLNSDTAANEWDTVQ